MKLHPIQFEAIEPRLFLDATATLGSHGVFKITGTDAGETITVALSADSTLVEATVDGVVVGSAAVADVKAIFVSAGAGDDTVNIDAAITQRTLIRGGDGNDTITAGDNNNFIDGGAGTDTIKVGNGNNRINGGGDADTITAGSGKNVITGGDGDDIITAGVGGVGVSWLFGNDGSDVLTSNGAESHMFGGLGDDTITGSDGNDTIYGGDGTDSLSGGASGTDSVNEDSPVFGGGGFFHGPRGGGHFGGCGLPASSSNTGTNTGTTTSLALTALSRRLR